jgi:very-short-patch-repair endonuclease
MAFWPDHLAGGSFWIAAYGREESMDARGDTPGPLRGSDYEPLLAALEQLRLRLLDLTGRNRLLNFRHTVGRALQFVEGQPAAVYEKLVEGNTRGSIAITGLPEPPQREWVERNGRPYRPEPSVWAMQQRIPTSYDLDERCGEAAGLRALLYLDDLATHCRKIEREAVLAIEETGANMLFLVLGFLEYPDQRDSDRIFCAPLITVPVSLVRRESGGHQIFSLQYTGEDVTENLSLREKLKTDHALILPDLPEEQINVETYFFNIRSIIKDRPGFALRRRISLCLLSFTNMLLVRDLDPEKWPKVGEKHALLDHPLVREIFQGTDRGEGADGDWGIAQEHDVEEGPAARIPLVFDADSSQHSALVDVLTQRKNVVIEGPPGTGKSQTITNLIAAAIAEGKTILFVAEKLAALEVVKSRLTRADLDPFLLELHSNKTNKKRVLEELSKRVRHRPSPPADLPRKLQELEGHRNDLHDYCDLINSTSFSAFGKTLHQIMWRSERHRMALSIDYRSLNQRIVADAPKISELELNRRMDCLKYLGDQYRLLGGFDPNCPFWGFFPEPIVPGEETQLQTVFHDCSKWTGEFVESVSKFYEVVGDRSFGLTLDEARRWLQALQELLERTNPALPLHLTPHLFRDDRTGLHAKQRLEAFAVQIARYHDLMPTVANAIRTEEAVTPDVLGALRDLECTAGQLGTSLGTPAELRSLCSRLQAESVRLKTALTGVEEFCERHGIPFDGSRDRLRALSEFAQTITEAPKKVLHLQTPGLVRDGACQAVEALAGLQREWTEMAAELDRVLYLDALPGEETLKQAVLTFREGEAWYRVFQARWRAAVAIHRSLQRTKRRIALRDRRGELERVITLLRLKERWRADPAWPHYIGQEAPAHPVALDGYVTLARWNRAIKLLLEEIGPAVFSPVDLTPERARTLRRAFADFEAQLSAALSALNAVDTLLTTLSESSAGLPARISAQRTARLAAAIEAQLPWLEANALPDVRLTMCRQACEAAIERRGVLQVIDSDREIKGLLGEHFAGIETDVCTALATVAFGRDLERYRLPDQIVEKLKTDHPLEAAERIFAALPAVLKGLQKVDAFTADLSAFGTFDLETWVGAAPNGDLASFAAALRKRAEAAAERVDELVSWSLYLARRREAKELGLEEFALLLERRQIPPSDIATSYAYCTYATIVREAFRFTPQLGRFSGLKHHQIREEFKRLDREIIEMRGKAIAAVVHQNTRPPPGRNGPRVDEKTDMVLLGLLMAQQRPRMPVRKILARAGRAIQALKPCFMMGPQAVAQYLTPGVISFDLVVMDEASQLKPEEAIGAIARGSQLVVVGDPKQLPPTSFFSRMNPTADDEQQYTTTDAESILDVCTSHFRPPRALRWHYRSQHHSLIAFSNRNFYHGNLIIFPSPYRQSSRLGIRATYLADAIYDNQTNMREAQRVVDAVAEHIKTRPDDSLGVVTLNIKQRDLIADLLDERLRNLRGADEYRERWKEEQQPLFVKNLENVQGDERDAIIVSTTFGKPPNAAAVRPNFGPISRQGGWRRLNVLFTRARKSIGLYTSMRPEDIVVDGTTPEGTKALRDYLEYARSGIRAVAEDNALEPESDFEIAVIDVLRQRGYEITPQLGVAGYRIDLAVKHPDAPSVYLAAVECDGASYHSALSVRDRDRIRQEILESLGWRGRIWRIWSTDWFRAPVLETEKLMRFLDDLRRSWKPEHTAGELWVEEGAVAAPAPIPLAQTGAAATAAEKRQQLLETILRTDDDVEIEVGDLVHYVDVLKPDDVLSIRITPGASDLPNGLISANTPLAQALLGAVASDEVPLHLPGGSRRLFRIVRIAKPDRLAAE